MVVQTVVVVEITIADKQNSFEVCLVGGRGYYGITASDHQCQVEECAFIHRKQYFLTPKNKDTRGAGLLPTLG